MMMTAQTRVARCLLLTTGLIVLPANHCFAINWTPVSGGNWSTGFGVDYPDSNAETAVFNRNITVDATVFIDVADAMALGMTLTDATTPSNNWIIASTDPANNKLTFARNTTGASSINSTTGSNVISAPIVIGGTNDLQLTVTGTRLTLSGPITEPVGVPKAIGTSNTTGTIVLLGPVSYTKFTNLAAGTLLLDGTHTGSGDYIVAAGATLGGSTSDLSLASGKSVNFNTASGVLSNFTPGDGGAGSFTVNGTAGTGGVNLSGGNYKWEIGSLVDAGALGVAGSGSSFDQLVLNGAGTTKLTLGGSSTLSIGFAGVGNPDAGDPFWNADHLWKVIDVTGTTTTMGAFTTLANFDFAAGDFTTFIGNGTTGDLGDVYVQYTAVPEPATAALSALALAFAAMRRRA